MLTEQVLNCRKVKYGMGAPKPAVKARRVKTNFKTEPQAMIWREKPIYMVSHNNYSNAFHLPHPFHWRRPKKFTVVITIFPSRDLGPTEDSGGLLSLYAQGREALEGQCRNHRAARYPSKPTVWAQKPLVRANALKINSAKD